jgi:hypothetical protein
VLITVERIVVVPLIPAAVHEYSDIRELVVGVNDISDQHVSVQRTIGIGARDSRQIHHGLATFILWHRVLGRRRVYNKSFDVPAREMLTHP